MVGFWGCQCAFRVMSSLSSTSTASPPRSCSHSSSLQASLTQRLWAALRPCFGFSRRSGFLRHTFPRGTEVRTIEGELQGFVLADLGFLKVGGKLPGQLCSCCRGCLETPEFMQSIIKQCQKYRSLPICHIN